MSYKVIPDDLEKFILDTIDSVAEMEALLLLRANPETEWNAEGLAERLYISETQTADILSRLCTQGFFISVDKGTHLAYRYQPGSTELRQMVDRIADIYARHLVPVTNLIHSKAKSRVQEFADAFRLRKDK